MGGLAGPVPLWGGHARARTAQPVFCKSHTCPVGTAGAEGPPIGYLSASLTAPRTSPWASPGKVSVRPITLTNPGPSSAPLRASQSLNYERVKKVSNP